MTEEFRVATPRVAAGVLLRDEEGSVLLVKPTYKDGWDIPGGYVEPGESPRAAARREVLEELGVDVEVGRLLLVDWAPHPDEGDKLLFVFDGDLNGQPLTLDPAELSEARYVQVGAFPDFLNARLRTRLASAAQDRPDAYTEFGA